MTAHDEDLALTIERLRANADRLCAVAGAEWRLVTASDMGCLTFETGIGPVGRRRDSGPIDTSNFRVILADLQTFDGRVTPIRFDHGQLGWFEEIAVPLDNSALAGRIAAWFVKLDRDTAADIDDLAALTTEQQHPQR